jgi:hypothetical protein
MTARVAGLSIALAFTAPVVRAAMTTVDANNSPYTVPGNQIASGDTVIVVDGGSLANGSLDLLSGSKLEFSITATARNPMVQGTQLTGVGTVIKSAAGTLRYGTTNTIFSGTTELKGGTFTTPGFLNSDQAFGTNGTVEFAEGFFSPASANGFTLSQRELIVNADGGGIDFSGNLGQAVLSGCDRGYDGIVKSGTGTFEFTGDLFIPDVTTAAWPASPLPSAATASRALRPPDVCPAAVKHPRSTVWG